MIHLEAPNGWPFLFITLAIAVWGIWSFLTWYFADDEKLLAPANNRRVTFKQVVQAQFRDIADLFKPITLAVSDISRRQWAFWGPRLTNRAMLATLAADMAIVASGQDVWTFMADHPIVAAGVVAMNLLTPLSPNGAPASIPAR